MAMYRGNLPLKRVIFYSYVTNDQGLSSCVRQEANEAANGSKHQGAGRLREGGKIGGISGAPKT